MTNKQFLESLGFIDDSYANFNLVYGDVLFTVSFEDYALTKFRCFSIDDIDIPKHKDWRQQVQILLSLYKTGELPFAPTEQESRRYVTTFV